MGWNPRVVGGVKRLDYIDVAKGVGILLVIIGHLTSPQWIVNAWIQNFHMPLFFIISGMLYNLGRYPSFAAYARRKCRVLLKPLVVFILLNLALTYLMGLDYYKLETIVSLRFPNAMWFVWVLLLTELSFHPVARMGKWSIWIVLMVNFLISALLHVLDMQCPLNMTSLFPAIGFYGLGYLSKDVCTRFYCSSRNGMMWLAALMLLLPLAMALLFTGRMDIAGNTVPRPQLLFIISATLASVGLIKLCTCIYWKRLKSMLLFWGRTSITTLCLHVCFLHIALKYITIQPHALYKIVELAFVLTMSASASYAMDRWGKDLIK